MQIRNFRGDEFINREEEIAFFKEYFTKVPRRILWAYGPKSTGKTTLIEYVIENELDDGAYWVKYLNLRGLMLSSYDDFLYAFFEEKEEEGETTTRFNKTYDLKLFKLEARTVKAIKEKRKNLFVELTRELANVDKKKIIVINEIQTLQDVYMNGEKKLLNEFLNFLVRLTKELHLSHVVILTSNTLFLNEIYTNSKLKETSEFMLIDHLKRPDIQAWLSGDPWYFSETEIATIYDYLGGSVPRIKKLLDSYKRFASLEVYLDREVTMAQSEIHILFEQKRLTREQKEQCYFVARQILEHGYFDNNQYEGYFDIITLFDQVEILFFDPMTNQTTANSRIYVKAFERMIDRQTNRKRVES